MAKSRENPTSSINAELMRRVIAKARNAGKESVDADRINERIKKAKAITAGDIVLVPSDDKFVPTTVKKVDVKLGIITVRLPNTRVDTTFGAEVVKKPLSRMAIMAKLGNKK